jgi:steroid delta-isomerase-like uncharacterized protein
MGTCENKALVGRLIEECVNEHRADLLDRFVDARLRMHPGTPGASPDTEGLDELEQAFSRFRTTFPDLHVSPEDMIAEGDLVAARWTATGTHAGPLAGIPPTGRAVRWSGIDVYRLLDGRIVEWWRNDDLVGLLQQVGRDPLSAG